MTRLIVVGKTEPIHAQLMDLLRSENYQLEIVETAEAVLELIKKRVPDLILGENNLSLVSIFRKNPLTATIPLIVICQQAQRHEWREAIEAGADDFLFGPFEAAEVQAAVLAQLEKRARLTTHYNTELNAAVDFNKILLDYMPDLLFLVRRDGLVLDCHAGKYGPVPLHPPTELIGKNMTDILTPAQVKERFYYIEQALESRQIQIYDYNIEFNDQQLRYEESRVVAISPEVVLIFIRDITRQKEAELALRESEERFYTFMEHSPVVAWINDENAKAIYVNRAYCKLNQTTPEATVGKSLDELFPLDLAEIYLQSHREILESGQSQEVVQPFRYADNRLGSGLYYRFLLTDAKGRQMVGGQGLDITALLQAEEALRQTEEKLRQAQKLESIGRLAGGVAHDFNNLLTAILGYTDLLIAIVDETYLPELEEIRKAAERAAELTRQLLAFSRKQVLQPKVLDLNQIILNVEKLLRRLIGEDIDLQTKISLNLGKVMADPAQFEQIIINLAVNARDAMPQGGKITIETANVTIDAALVARQPQLSMGEYVRVSVRDNGEGIDPTILPLIFEPFFTTKDPGKGTGLGLSTVYGIVQQSGGAISVESQVGLGTVFHIYLPFLSQTQLEPSPLLPDQSKNLRGSETILLVEDEEAVMSLTRRVLEESGYTLLTARSGLEALQVAEKAGGKIDLVVSDVVMPQMNGPKLAAELRNRYPGLRILFMSGYTDTFFENKESFTRNTAFIQKPFVPGTLRQRIRQLLDASPAIAP